MIEENLTFRSIEHTEQYEREMQAIMPDARRADEFIEGTVWLLCRRPEYGTPIVAGSSVRFVSVTKEAVDIPPLVLYYTFNENYVYFLSIQVSCQDETY